MTKGQASPTSEVGKVTGSTPMGSLDRPINPISVALAAEASFVARSLDVMGDHLRDTLEQAAEHDGSVFVEIMQNCNIFNDGTWAEVRDRDRRDDNSVLLTHGEPLVFGKHRDKGIRMNDMRPEVVALGDGVTEDDLLVYDQTNGPLAYMISRVTSPAPIGIFKRVSLPTYEAGVHGQIREAREKKGDADLMKLIHSGDTWEVSA